MMKYQQDYKLALEDESFNSLFDAYLRPLGSKNARLLFKILLGYEAVGPLTTLDIEAKLSDLGMTLDKKEINGWLSSLLKAGLVYKETERGKPTTLRYDNKYTFDLWRTTDLGKRIAKGLSNVLEEKPTLLKGGLSDDLRAIAQADMDVRNKILMRLRELFLITNVIRILYENRKELSGTDLTESLRFSQEELEGVLSSFSNQDLNLISRKHLRQGFKGRLLNILRLSSTSPEYSLTDEGKRLAKALWLGHKIG